MPRGKGPTCIRPSAPTWGRWPRPRHLRSPTRSAIRPITLGRPSHLRNGLRFAMPESPVRRSGCQQPDPADQAPRGAKPLDRSQSAVDRRSPVCLAWPEPSATARVYVIATQVSPPQLRLPLRNPFQRRCGPHSIGPRTELTRSCASRPHAHASFGAEPVPVMVSFRAPVWIWSAHFREGSLGRCLIEARRPVFQSGGPTK